jgi:nitroreductase
MTYQDRYLAHQFKKKEELEKIIRDRHSDRVFGETIDLKLVEGILETISLCPSSCDRHGIYTKVITERDEKEILGGLLVGGVGWIHRAPAIVLLFADPEAYKERLLYMPHLDAGVVIYHLYLMATANKLKVCYCNPNIRDRNQLYFRDRFGNDIFCGAIALG